NAAAGCQPSSHPSSDAIAQLYGPSDLPEYRVSSGLVRRNCTAYRRPGSVSQVEVPNELERAPGQEDFARARDRFRIHGIADGRARRLRTGRSRGVAIRDLRVQFVLR